MFDLVFAEVVRTSTQNNYVVVTVKNSDNTKDYRVDVSNGRCSCPAWKFSKPDLSGKRKPCKHLRQFGYVEN